MRRFFPNQEEEEKPEELEEVEPEEPEPPARVTNKKEVTLTKYQITFHYDNGDIEKVETYSRGDKEDDVISYKVDPHATYREYYEQLKYTFDKIERHYYTMSREPEVKKLQDETWILEWEERNSSYIKNTKKMYKKPSKIAKWE